MIVRRPQTLDEALALRTDGPTIPIAGGTDLLVHWPERLEAHAGTYIDLWPIESLHRIVWRDGDVELGALTSYLDVVRNHEIRERFPMLVDAARQVGAIQIQSRGTWGGNIANGSPAADGVPVLMAYGADVVVRSAATERVVPLERFYTGYKEMDLHPDELIVAIRIPQSTPRAQRFIKVGSRRAQAIAKVGAAIIESTDGWRVVASSAAPTVRRCPNVERLFDDGVPPSEDAVLAALDEDVAPIDDLRSTADYRRRVLARSLYFARRELEEL